MKRLALILVLTASAFAQPQLGPSHTYGPYFARRDAGRPVAAATKAGALQVWSGMVEGVARVHAQRLDLNGTPIGTPIVLPAVTRLTNAVSPAIATNGSDFLIVWHEWPLSGDAFVPTVVMTIVDRSGNVIVPPAALQSPDRPNSNNPPARTLTAVWNGIEYEIASINTRWRINASGVVIAAEAPFARVDAVAPGASGETFVASTTFVRDRVVCSGFSAFIFCRTEPEESTLAWRRVGAAGNIASGSERRTSTRAGTPSIAARASEAVMVWHAANVVEAIRIDVTGRIVDRTPLDAVPLYPFDARPQIAFDGRRYLAAWRTESGVQAATLDDLGWSEPFAIEAGPQHEIGVHALVPDRFLLTWAESTTERTHGWRTILFDPLPLRRRPTR